jgi:beta-N-acetylhexosaminidase
MKVRVDAVGGATSLADRKRRAGQRLMLGFLGPSVDTDLRKLVAEVQPMGFVLFARNLVEPEQARELCRELAGLASPYDPALIATDHEGGRVQRLPEPAVRWPSMRVLGQAERESGGRGDWARKMGQAMGQELAALGITLNLGPVADVDGGTGTSGIGDRSFGSDPQLVAQCVAAYLEGLHEAGVSGCAKHFPGLGAAAADSHAELPAIERDLPELREKDLPPFQAAVAAGVEVVMVGHTLYPAWDEEWPATLSGRIVPQLLRRELGFDGVVLSDDLEMKALARWSWEERARRAADAVDVLMSCDDREAKYRLFRELVLAQEEDRTHEDRAILSVRRVEQLRERTLLRQVQAPPLSALGRLEDRMLAELVRSRGEGT